MERRIVYFCAITIELTTNNLKHQIHISLILALFSILFLSSCEKLKGKGGNITITPDTLAFFAINIDMPCDVNITYGDSLHFSITAQENIINNISYHVEDYTLFFEFVQTAYDYNRIQLNFTMPDFRGLSVSDDCEALINSAFETVSRMHIKMDGLGRINFQDTIKCYEFKYENFSGISNLQMSYLECEQFNYSVVGIDGAQISGKTGISTANITGESIFNALTFEAEKYNIDISGLVEEMNINVSETLNVDVSGEAKIQYTGSPHTVNNTSEGTLDLIPISK